MSTLSEQPTEQVSTGAMALPVIVYTSIDDTSDMMSGDMKEALQSFAGNIGVIFSMTNNKVTPIRIYFSGCKREYDVAPSGIHELLQQAVEEARSTCDENLSAINELAQLTDTVLQKLRAAGKYDESKSILENFQALEC